MRGHRIREQRLTAHLCPCASERDERTAEADGVCRGEGSIGSRQFSHLSWRDEGGPRYLIERKDAGGRVRSHGDSLRRGKSLAYVERAFAAKTCLRLCSARDRCPRLESFDKHQALALRERADDAETALFEQRVDTARQYERRRRHLGNQLAQPARHGAADHEETAARPQNSCDLARGGR